MHVRLGPAGKPAIRYKAGDYVRLTHDERDPNPTAFQGDWGRVIRVVDGTLDIQLAGHGRARSAALDRVLGLPAWAVAPCDHHGQPTLPVRERTRPVQRAAATAPIPVAPPRRAGRLAWLVGAGALGCIVLVGLALR